MEFSHFDLWVSRKNISRHRYRYSAEHRKLNMTSIKKGKRMMEGRERAESLKENESVKRRQG